ncbi:LytTR family transcriptional regulator [Sporosarcina sp. ANT_H38]|uniref:LytTR family DNA-binding domain-containing protein n=1 Tax=Sporosarcina sp. ANT_H38 TaxID=2597358 RepID=UPI0011F0BD67|nr:LytTR family DNA-binding domain-containing protein [Sporosarcina sp. ANT_H38]KAA0965899.1 LytTR family transcriptional regulator [Sporosarcina sp. ANT_H38]
MLQIPQNGTILTIVFLQKGVVIIRLTIHESEEYDEVEIIIKCQQIDNRLERLIEQIKQTTTTINGTRDGRTYSLVVDNVYYIESIDNRSFLYNEKDVYENDLKLYEIEKMLVGTHFVRISKNLVVNTAYIESVRALFNGKFEASLTNGEIVIVNRHYVKLFKEKFLTRGGK